MKTNADFQLDHIFICTAVGAPEAERLVEFGLAEGSSNVHPGQGTANRRFFFRNGALELLWVADSIEAQSAATQPTHLWERWAGRDDRACPFGFCFRPKTSDTKGQPFACWEYRPVYLPPPLCMHIATNSDTLTEPMLVFLAFAREENRRAAFEREPLKHRTGPKEITRVELITPHAEDCSSELKALINSGLLKVREGEKYLLNLGFDLEPQGTRTDFRPLLPLTFYS